MSHIGGWGTHYGVGRPTRMRSKKFFVIFHFLDFKQQRPDPAAGRIEFSVFKICALLSNKYCAKSKTRSTNHEPRLRIPASDWPTSSELIIEDSVNENTIEVAEVSWRINRIIRIPGRLNAVLLLY